MDIHEFTKIANEFAIDGRLIFAEPYGCGHINGTYCLYFDCGCRPPKRYIFQHINSTIFTNVDGLMQNIVKVTSYLREYLFSIGKDGERGTLRVIPTKAGAPYALIDGKYFRVYDFVENTFSLQSVENAAQFESLAETFGNFQNQLAAFDASSLVETIPNFHNTLSRFEQLKAAISEDKAERAATVASEIDFALKREADAGLLIGLAQKGELPLRVTHNDTKLNNVLFDADTSQAACVIDLDTVMPGLVHYDFGDSIRFGASTAAEDEKDLSKVEMSLELFEAYARGFLRACGDKLTDTEIRYLPFSAKLMTYECGIRFLADYLNGDTYFRVHYADQNLDRCRTQFKLVADMEKKMDAMQAIIQKLLK